MPPSENAVIWILCGVKGKDEKVMQIGINKSVRLMLKNELNKNRGYILNGLLMQDGTARKKAKITGRQRRYETEGKALRDWDYDSLVFYELNIEKYLKMTKI